MEEHRFPFNWRMVDGYPAEGIEPNGMKVFGTFICGGGSSMGYKLAGYDHLGGVELDPKVCEIYERNHHPKYLFAEDLREFNKREDLPEELYHLDVLDGSPPCSTLLHLLNGWKQGEGVGKGEEVRRRPEDADA